MCAPSRRHPAKLLRCSGFFFQHLRKDSGRKKLRFSENFGHFFADFWQNSAWFSQNSGVGSNSGQKRWFTYKDFPKLRSETAETGFRKLKKFAEVSKKSLTTLSAITFSALRVWAILRPYKGPKTVLVLRTLAICHHIRPTSNWWKGKSSNVFTVYAASQSWLIILITI